MIKQIKCRNCKYVGEPEIMFKDTKPTPFCPSCGTSDVEITWVGA